MAGKYAVYGSLQAFALTSAKLGNLSQQACDYDSIVLPLHVHVYCLYKNIEQHRINFDTFHGNLNSQWLENGFIE